MKCNNNNTVLFSDNEYQILLIFIECYYFYVNQWCSWHMKGFISNNYNIFTTYWNLQFNYPNLIIIKLKTLCSTRSIVN